MAVGEEGDPCRLHEVAVGHVDELVGRDRQRVLGRGVAVAVFIVVVVVVVEVDVDVDVVVVEESSGTL